MSSPRSTADNNPKRFSPSPQRLRDRPESSTAPPVEYDQNRWVIVEEDAFSFRQLGSIIQSQAWLSNADILNAIPDVTGGISSVNVMEVFTTDLTTPENLTHTLVGFAAMVNRLMFQIAHLTRELEALKTSDRASGMRWIDALDFKKSNVTGDYYFDEKDGIPSRHLNTLINGFDQAGTLRNETAITKIRRFVLYMLQNMIPKHLHNKFTIRGCGGVERLTDLPTELTDALKAMCLESVNMHDPQTADEKDQQNELNQKIYILMQYTL